MHRQTSILCDSLRVQFCVLEVLFNKPFAGLKPELYSITFMRTVLYGEIIWGVDIVYINTVPFLCKKS